MTRPGALRSLFTPGCDPVDRSAGQPSVDPRAILTSIGEVVYDWDLASDAITWGVNACEVLGLPDLGGLDTGRAYAEAVEPGTGTTRRDAILTASATDTGSGVPYRARYGLHTPSGALMTVEDTGRWYADTSGVAAFAHGVIRIDRNTGGEEEMPSSPGSRERAGFIAQIADEVAGTARSRRSMTLLTVAIEDLGRINDELGYDGADMVVREVVARMRQVMRRRDRFVRYSGNRFALALLSCPSDQARLAADRLASSVSGEPIATAQGAVRVRLRIGAATAPEHAIDSGGLLLRAEEALRIARSSFGRLFSLYDPSQGRETAGRSVRGTPAIDVIDALNTGRIGFARQPIVSARGREVCFSEALLRLTATCGSVVNAGDILPAVETAGLVPLLDARILHLAAEHLSAHPQERLSINVSPLTLEGPEWLAMLEAQLGARPGIAPRLIIEITETAAVRDPIATRGRLEAMKALGLTIALDDFGAGHTSFKHLRSFPIDILKIDGAFVQNLSRSADDRFFVRTLVDLARHLGIATVAEWVEDEETAGLLTEWGIDFLQGEHCGAPRLAGGEGTIRSTALSA